MCLPSLHQAPPPQQACLRASAARICCPAPARPDLTLTLTCCGLLLLAPHTQMDANLELAESILGASASARGRRNFPARSGVVAGLEATYWDLMSKGTKHAYPTPNAQVRYGRPAGCCET